MHYRKAIAELIEFNPQLNPSLIFVVNKEDGTVDGQIQTGIPTHPLIAVNNSIVCESDLMEVLEHLDCPTPIFSAIQPTHDQTYSFLSDEYDVWGCSFQVV